MNCLLIEMGEMACYQERCPQCGRIPPGRKALPGKKFKTIVGRTLSNKQHANNNSSVNDELRTHPAVCQNERGAYTAYKLHHPKHLL